VILNIKLVSYKKQFQLQHFLQNSFKKLFIQANGSDGDAVPIQAGYRDYRYSYLILARKIAQERLTQKQRHILRRLSLSKLENISGMVRSVSSELNCSESAIWNSIRVLKRCGLVESNGHIRLTYLARTLLEGFEWTRD